MNKILFVSVYLVSLTLVLGTGPPIPPVPPDPDDVPQVTIITSFSTMPPVSTTVSGSVGQSVSERTPWTAEWSIDGRTLTRPVPPGIPHRVPTGNDDWHYTRDINGEPTIVFDFQNKNDLNTRFWKKVHRQAQLFNPNALDMEACNGGIYSLGHTFRSVLRNDNDESSQFIPGWVKCARPEPNFNTGTLGFTPMFGTFRAPQDYPLIENLSYALRNTYNEWRLKKSKSNSDESHLFGDQLTHPSNTDLFLEFTPHEINFDEKKRRYTWDKVEFYKLDPYMFLHSNPQLRTNVSWTPFTPIDIVGAANQAPKLIDAQPVDDFPDLFDYIEDLPEEYNSRAKQLRFNAVRDAVRRFANETNRMEEEDRKDCRECFKRSGWPTDEVSTFYDAFEKNFIEVCRKRRASASQMSAERMNKRMKLKEAYDRFLEDTHPINQSEPDFSVLSSLQFWGVWTDNGPALQDSLYVGVHELQHLWEITQRGLQTAPERNVGIVISLWSNFTKGLITYADLYMAMEQWCPIGESAEENTGVSDPASTSGNVVDSAQQSGVGDQVGSKRRASTSKDDQTKKRPGRPSKKAKNAAGVADTQVEQPADIPEYDETDNIMDPT